MANTDSPRVSADMTLAEVQAEGVLLLQKHHDPRGSEVTDAQTIDQAGAVLFNFYEDWLLALHEKIESIEVVVETPTVQIKDTRFTGATTTASIAAGASADFAIAMPTERVSVQWLRVRANGGEGGPGGRIQFFTDFARTKQVYDSDMVSGDPAEPVSDFVDGMAWGAYADDGSGLSLDESEIPYLYGTVTNGAESASTMTIRLIALCY